ncbi:hypothetical protein BPNPMPFG_006888 (plasmid) [Mesorhizobium sp. AR07]|uniref:hypothetical protein n=1 Tax=Mesorhizobium sp. AR07 TaxID=2865838 RepID=UPI00215E8900|nr:hypothetical protein [Mesorhizobium sp. AR07]UVK49163.1 hypothetical protein BPNPMPFG_006888 [Mesorhizobium sp. AR07]
MNETAKPPRPALPRDAFRAQRISSDPPPGAKPVVITPHYDDQPTTQASTSAAPQTPHATLPNKIEAPKSAPPAKPKRENPRKPFDAYGERSSSRPYALRLPDAIDLVLRQIAAEERTHPLRIIDRVLHDYLKRIGRLPPSHDA